MTVIYCFGNSQHTIACKNYFNVLLILIENYFVLVSVFNTTH